MDQFSSDFAEHWDELVGWQKRSEADTSFLLGLLQKYKVRRVLDVALGTGFHSIKLLSAGMQVKSVDISQAMIKVAQKNARLHSVELDVVCADWASLSNEIQGTFDCIICLGNSLACEMSPEKRQAAASHWSKMLSEDGIIVVDRRNYESLLLREYSLNAKGQYFGETVKINCSKLTPEETIFSYTFLDGKTFDLKMYPILDTEIKSIFANVGLNEVEFYGDRRSSYAAKDVAFYLHLFKRVKYG